MLLAQLIMDQAVTITFPSHTFQAGDIILFGDASTFSAITNSNFVLRF